MSISLCMIAKNEAATLERGLRSVAGLVSEAIVVDTGSTDDTKEVAASFGANVFDFPWVDSFAAARNEALRHATGDWIFSLDADEYLDSENREKFRALTGRLEEGAAYMTRQRSGGVAVPILDFGCRLFRNRPDTRWTFRVHEQILPAVGRAGHKVHFTDICIDHTGYTDPVVRAQKAQRNLRLLLLEEAEQPDNPVTLIKLAGLYQDLGQPARAIPYLKRCLRNCDLFLARLRLLGQNLAATDRRMRDNITASLRIHTRQANALLRDALAWCRSGRARCPDDAEWPVGLPASAVKGVR